MSQNLVWIGKILAHNVLISSYQKTLQKIIHCFLMQQQTQQNKVIDAIMNPE